MPGHLQQPGHLQLPGHLQQPWQPGQIVQLAQESKREGGLGAFGQERGALPGPVQDTTRLQLHWRNSLVRWRKAYTFSWSLARKRVTRLQPELLDQTWLLEGDHRFCSCSCQVFTRASRGTPWAGAQIQGCKQTGPDFARRGVAQESPGPQAVAGLPSRCRLLVHPYLTFRGPALHCKGRQGNE